VLVTAVTFFSFVINAVLAWGLVLGVWGFPRLGIAGAALATVIAQAVAAFLYLLLFSRSGGLKDKVAARFRWPELKNFLKLAMPMGLRISGELAAWTLFLVVIGRLGTVPLAASSLAFRINGMAFFPALGLGQAAGVLVGHARGAGKDHEVPAITWQALAVCELWMLGMSLLFVLCPGPLMSFFVGSGPESGQVVETGILLLKFVAFYCLFDAANVTIGCVLASAGDTHWIARSFFICGVGFLILLGLIDRFSPSLVAEWTLATSFVFLTALLWLLRFKGERWKGTKVLHDLGTGEALD